jgi:hypothetical protein
VAATEHIANRASRAGHLIAAALMLPGLMPLAQAESPPEHNELALKFLSYEDRQPGLDRISVSSPSAQLSLKLGEQWGLTAQGTHDAISGASPRYHSAISGASHMHDERNAVDLKATRYFSRASVTLGVNSSIEHDYKSNGLSAQARLASDDNNRTWTFGSSVSKDRIDPVNQIVVGEHKRVASFFGGVSQVLTANDIVQVNLGLNRGRGYFSDPYKSLDNRPRSRDQRTLYVGWNHFVETFQAALRTSYRAYNDSWGVTAHTLALEWQQPVGHGVSLTPSLRYSSQSAARFFYGPTYDMTLGAPFPPGYVLGSNAVQSADQRLSAFGAITGGIKADWQINPTLAADIGLDLYSQRGAWKLGGSGTKGLANFNATMVQTGLTWRF